MNDPQETTVAGEETPTLTDEEIETRPLATSPHASVDDDSDPGDAGDDTGDDAGDDTGDEADPSDTGDDSGDDSGDSGS